MTTKRVTQKDVLFLSISFFVIVFAWLAFNSYHAYVTSTISENLQMQITPIDGSFDIKTLDLLKTRQPVEPAFTALQPTTTPEISSAEASLEPTITTTITPTPQLNELLIATPSGVLSP